MILQELEIRQGNPIVDDLPLEIAERVWALILSLIHI